MVTECEVDHGANVKYIKHETGRCVSEKIGVS
jgi:hypothetical protein